ncbi:MAG: hypothetical protein JWP64_2349, partial [Pseudonocardia sp.]|nr:hypothetical protein [Pseudonocardia sp.]
GELGAGLRGLLLLSVGGGAGGGELLGEGADRGFVAAGALFGHLGAATLLGVLTPLGVAKNDPAIPAPPRHLPAEGWLRGTSPLWQHQWAATLR